MRNSSIAELAKYVELKRTPVIVVDSVEYLSEREWKAAQRALKESLETLKATRISGFQAFSLGNKIVARFLENSRAHTLYALKAQSGGLQVIREN